MKRNTITQKIFGLLFVVCLFAFAIGNWVTESGAIIHAIDEIRKPTKAGDLKHYVSRVEGILNDNIVGKDKFIDGYAYLQVLMGKEESDNFAMVLDQSGSLNYTSFFQGDILPMREYAKRLWRLQEEAKKRGCKVFFVNPPPMYHRGQSEYSAGLPYNDQNAKQDMLLYYLRTYGVDYIDLRTTLPKHNIPINEYFFKTDHHWTIETSFYAFADVIEMMDDRYDANLDPMDFHKDLRNYNTVTYSDAFLGSMGRTTGAVFSGLDDFTLIWPKSEDQFGISGKEDGPYSTTLLNRAMLDTDDPYGSTNPYNAYIGPIKSRLVIRNKSSSEGPKVLLIHDSYFIPVSAFMAPIFREIHMIWPLAETDRVDIEKYIAENKFDYIIVELFPGNLDENGFSFYKDMTKIEIQQMEEIQRIAQEDTLQ